MAPPRTVLVVNPQSQNATLGKRWPELSKIVRQELGSFEAVLTKRAGDATGLAREALQSGAELVVAIGGDGTINEVANGFFDHGRAIAPDACLGILPFGTGGDFRKSIHLPKDFRAAAQILARGRKLRIDVGQLDYTTRDGGSAMRMFVNIASFGISGEVDEQVNRSSKRLGGRLTFLLATARVGVKYQNKRVRLVFDDDKSHPVDATIHTVAVANGRYFGGGMNIAPEAEIDDGYFDVVALGDFQFRDFVLHGPRIYSGSHLTLDKVSHRRARTIYAEPLDQQTVLLDVDGEAPGQLPATFSILPRALQIVIP